MKFKRTLRPKICFTLFAFLFTNLAFAQSKAVLVKEFIYESAPFPSCHASTLAETPDGLAAAWFGGTREKNPDVEIYFSILKNGKWSTPVSVANGIQHADKRYPCWNPVLFQVPNGQLILFYKVGPDPSHWWGEMKESADGGETWSENRRLPEDIFGPIKNKPVLLEDGRLLCPSSKETEIGEDDHWQVFVEETSDWGKTWSITKPLNDGVKTNAIQPSILSYADGRLQMLCRSRENRLMSFWSDDKGKNWGEVEITDIPNPNSGTDAVTLKDGRQLLVYNPNEKNAGKWGGSRSPLSVAISWEGRVWEKILDLEDEPGEFSYPAVIQTTDGQIHISYTHQRTKIRHVVLDPSKI